MESLEYVIIGKMFFMLIRALIIFALSSVYAHAAELPFVQVKEVSNLQQDGQLAKQSNRPILIMFSIEDCPYCEFVREEHLKPMLRNAKYKSQVIIRELHTDVTESVINFDGRRIDAERLADRYNVSFNPTVVFLDAQGRELSKRIVGVSSVDFYGGFMDKAIQESNQRLRAIVSAE